MMRLQSTGRNPYVHDVDERGARVLPKQFKRDQVATVFARLEPWLIGIEACCGAHYWAAKLTGPGHRVTMGPQFVKPCVEANKLPGSRKPGTQPVAFLG